MALETPILLSYSGQAVVWADHHPTHSPTYPPTPLNLRGRISPPPQAKLKLGQLGSLAWAA